MVFQGNLNCILKLKFALIYKCSQYLALNKKALLQLFLGAPVETGIIVKAYPKLFIPLGS